MVAQLDAEAARASLVDNAESHNVLCVYVLGVVPRRIVRAESTTHRFHGRVDESMGGWMDGWIDGWMDGWMGR